MLELLVGPEPSVMQGVDHRFRLAIPTAYVPSDFVDQLVPEVAVSRAVFVATLEDFSPAGDRRADGSDVFSGAISWIKEDFVRSAAEGTRLSSFSQYEVQADEEFGLEVKIPKTYSMFPQKLYIFLSDDESTMIECAYSPAPDRPQFCHMWDQRSGRPLLELFFRQDLLAQWQRLRDGSRVLMDQWVV